MAPSMAGVLASLLVSCFTEASTLSAFIRSSSAMERLARELPGPSASLVEMADSAAALVIAHGIPLEQFCDELARIRPCRAHELRRISKKALDMPELASSRDADRLPRRPLRLIIPLSAILVAAILGITLRAAPSSDAASPVTPRVAITEWPAFELVGRDADLPVALDPPTVTDITLTVVSVRTGISWRVSLSRFRTAESAARDIFRAFHLKGDRQIYDIFVSDAYALCQANHCYTLQLVGEALDISQPVHVKKISADSPLVSGPSMCLGCH